MLSAVEIRSLCCVVIGSWHEVLTQGLGNGMGPIANAQFRLRVLHVRSYRLFTQHEFLRDLLVRLSHRHEPQDRQLSGGSRGTRPPRQSVTAPTICSSRIAAKLAAPKIMILAACVSPINCLPSARTPVPPSDLRVRGGASTRIGLRKAGSGEDAQAPEDVVPRRVRDLDAAHRISAMDLMRIMGFSMGFSARRRSSPTPRAGHGRRTASAPPSNEPREGQDSTGATSTP
jgi:hypothetical protein